MENNNTKKPNPILRLVLSVICGGLIGFIVMLLGESIGLLITSAAAALLISVIAYGLSINTGLQKLIAIITFIIGFFIYGSIFDSLNYGESEMLFFIFLFAPYMIITYLLTGIQQK